MIGDDRILHNQPLFVESARCRDSGSLKFKSWKFENGVKRSQGQKITIMASPCAVERL